MKHPILFTVCLVLLIGCAGASGSGAAQTRGGSDRMKTDEQAVRQWYERWIKATKEGDLELARSLIADDAVFLVPNAGRMDKESFAAAATGSDPNIDFELETTIEEIEILGDHAWLITKVSLAMTDKRTTTRSVMAGHTLSVLQRRGADWVVIRDANTMVPVPADQ